MTRWTYPNARRKDIRRAQAMSDGHNPALLRFESRAGHGPGKSTSCKSRN